MDHATAAQTAQTAVAESMGKNRTGAAKRAVSKTSWKKLICHGIFKRFKQKLGFSRELNQKWGCSRDLSKNEI